MMCLASNKFFRSLIFVNVILLQGLLSFAAETNSISVIGSGADLPEAMKNSLNQAVSTSFSSDKNLDKNEKAIQKNILENEVMNSPSQFVSSYKIMEGGQVGVVNISATIETDTIRALLNFIPKNFSSNSKEAKVLLLVKSVGAPSSLIDASLESGVDAILKERLLRRKFSLISAATLKDSSALGEDFTQPDSLKILGDTVNASLSIAFRMNYEQVENENSHSTEDRLQVNATIYDNRTAKVLARLSNSMLMPRSIKKESIPNDWSRVAAEDAGAFFQELLIKSGEQFLNSNEQKDGILLRIVDAPNFQVVNKIRLAIEAMKDVKQVLESSVRRGAYDFSIRSALDKDLLQKKILALSVEAVEIKASERPAVNDSMIVVDIKSKNSEQSPAPKEVNHE